MSLAVSAEKVAALEDLVVVCDEKKSLKRRMEKLEPLCRLRDRLKDLGKRCENGVVSPEKFDIEARKAHAESEVEECQKEQQKRHRSVCQIYGYGAQNIVF